MFGHGKKINRVFLTIDHPNANGRKPQPGEAAYNIVFPLEDGTFLTVSMGARGFATHTDLMMDMLTGRPSHTNGIPEEE